MVFSGTEELFGRRRIVPFLLSREGSGGEGTGDALGCDDWSDAREYREGVLNNEK